MTLLYQSKLFYLPAIDTGAKKRTELFPLLAQFRMYCYAHKIEDITRFLAAQLVRILCGSPSLTSFGHILLQTETSDKEKITTLL